jgi:hypothetical protein
LLEDRTLLSLNIVPVSAPADMKGDVVEPISIVAGDLNGTGVSELVDADQYGLTHSGYLASVDVWTPENGAFQSPDHVNLPLGLSRGSNDVALGDFDGRHSATGKPILDIAVVGDRGLTVLMNRDGYRSPISNTDVFPRSYLAVGDFTGNGNADLLVTGAGVPQVMLGNGDGSFQNPQGISTDGTYARRAVVGDFDGRHYANGLPILDVAVIAQDSSLHNLAEINVYMNQGQSTLAFHAPVSYAVGQNPSSIAVGDFRGDDKLDLAVANADNNNFSVLLGNGDGTFQPAVNYAVGGSPVSIGAGDFNGDGKLDIAVAYASSFSTVGVNVLLGTGKGTFLRAQIVETSNDFIGGSPLAVGDFVGAGYSGLAIADYSSGGISVFQGVGMSFFQPAGPLGGTGGAGVAVGNFSGDGKADVALNAATAGINVSPGNGDGTFSSPINSTGTFTGGATLVAGDFNGDGKLGLVWYAFIGFMGVEQGNGDGTFQPSFHLDNLGSLYSMAVGDFNGDGKLDLAMTLLGSDVGHPSDLRIYLANGDGTFGILNNGFYHPNHVYPGVGGGLGVGIAVGDFNGDGKLDLEVPGHGLLLGNGDGTFQTP